MSAVFAAAGPAVRIEHRSAGLSRGGRVAAWILAIACLMCALAAAGSAGIAPVILDARSGALADLTIRGSDAGSGGLTAATTGREGRGTGAGVDPSGTDVLQSDWSGETQHLDWRGTGYTTVETTILGDRVFSPGDQVSRSIRLINGGPGAGVLEVTLRPHELIPDDALNTALGDDVTLSWAIGDVTGSGVFSQLAQATPVSLGKTRLAAGAEVVVTVQATMDREVTTSRSAGTDSTLLTFDLDATLSGDTERIPSTGGTMPWPLILAGVGVVAAGAALLWAGRTRRCHDCDRRIARDEGWYSVVRLGGRRETLCEACGDAVPAAAVFA